MQGDECQSDQQRLFSSYYVSLFSPSVSLHPRIIDNSPPIDQILSESSLSSSLLQQIYSGLNQAILEYQQNAISQARNPFEQKELLFKARLFYSYFGEEKGVKEKTMFKMGQLRYLFGQVFDWKVDLTQKVSRMRANNRYNKIKGCILLHSMERLLLQITHAAFPWQLYQRRGSELIHGRLSFPLSESEEHLISQHSDIERDFVFKQQHFLKTSLLELKDEIESIQKRMKNEEEKLSRLSVPEYGIDSGQVGLVQQAQNLSYLQAQHFIHNHLSYISSFSCYGNSFSAQQLVGMIKKDPVLLLSIDQEEELALELKAYLGSYDEQAQHYHYLISWITSQQSELSKVTFVTLVAMLLSITGKWLRLSHHQSVFPLFEAYVRILKVVKLAEPAHISKYSQDISNNLKQYLTQLTNQLIIQNCDMISRVVQVDEELTLQLLTSPRIVSTLVGFQTHFVGIVEELAPLIQNISKLSVFDITTQVQPEQFISQVLALDGQQSQKKSKLGLVRGQEQPERRFKSLLGEMELILESNHYSVDAIRDHLREVKNILVLLQILSEPNRGRMMTQEKKQEHDQLRKLAKYFSKERTLCNVYELKSKLLLFMVLFRMGYHSPKIREQGNLVSLRNRILNLYNGLYRPQRGGSFLMSKIVSSIQEPFARHSLSERHEVYDPAFLNSFRRQQSVEDQDVGLQASSELQGRLNAFIKNKFLNTDENSKKYLINMINVLEEEMFELARDEIYSTEQAISQDYSRHLQTCLQLETKSLSQHQRTIMNIQCLFYLREYSAAWQILIDASNMDPSFIQYMASLVPTLQSNSQVLKTIRLSDMITRMQHFLFDQKDESACIDELTSSVNLNTSFPISREAVQAVYRIVKKQKRHQELQSFYSRKLAQGQSSQMEEFERVKSRLDQYQVLVSESVGRSRITVCLQLSSKHAKHFKQIEGYLKQYYLLSQMGIHKLIDIKQGNNGEELVIQMQSNSYKAAESQGQHRFDQNQEETLCRLMTQTIIQSVQIFKKNDLKCIYLEQDDVYVDLKSLSFSINPYLSIIESIITEQPVDRQPHNLHLLQLLLSITDPLRSAFSASFRSHLAYLWDQIQLVQQKGKQCSYDYLLELPLFMTLHQKQSFMIYFDNRMSEMCDDVHQEERNLKKEGNKEKYLKKRLQRMKESTYKVYSYYFIANGLLEIQIQQLDICKSPSQNKLDWVSKHPKLTMSYDLPRRIDSPDQIKQYAYTLNYLLKYLRGALAHKVEHTFAAIVNINQEFPMLIDFLYSHRHTLTASYHSLITQKDQLLKGCSQSLNTSLKEIEKLIQDGKQQFIDDNRFNLREIYAFKQLHNYSAQYAKIVRKKILRHKFKCFACKDFAGIVDKSSTLMNLLANLGRKINKKADFLSKEHTFTDCFLRSEFRNHRTIEVFGWRCRGLQAKHYLILNWWFFLETQFPCLMRCLSGSKHTWGSSC